MSNINSVIESPDDIHSNNPPLTEVGNAQRLVAKFGDRMHFHFQRDKWLRWTGRRWELDHGSSGTARFAKRIARNLLRSAADANGPLQDEMIRHAKRSESASGINAMLTLARSEAGILVTSDLLDSNPWHFNVQNATMDLHGPGRALKHDPAHLITKLAPVDFDPQATCPRWDKFLARAMADDEDLIGYLRRLAGLCLTGERNVQELFILHGGGANGKNVFIDTLMAMMGEYATLAPDGLVTRRARAEHPTEIADLLGRRLVVASELEDGEELRLAHVKRLTGDARLKGRFMKQDFFEFDRTHKLLIITNHRPLIRENTEAAWRRVRLIPWAVTIPEAERDEHLTEKLKAEWSGILNWAIRGCIEWQKNGMTPPAPVLGASREYRAEQDVHAEFFTDYCVIAPDAKVTRDQLCAAYEIWASTSHVRYPLTPSALYARVRSIDGVNEHQYRPDGSIPKRGFKGIGLLAGGEA